MGRFTKIIFFLLIFLFSFQVQAKNPPPGTGTSDLPANIYILLDHSGSMDRALTTAGEVSNIVDVNVDSSGNIYMMEFIDNRISVFDSSGNFVKRIGSFGTGCSQWQHSWNFDIHNDRLYIADYLGERIITLALDGSCVGTPVYAPYPVAITVGDRAAFTSYTDGSSTGYISTYLRAGDNLSWEGIYFDSVDEHLDVPWGMSLNSAGTKLIVADEGSNRMIEYTARNDYLDFPPSNLSIKLWGNQNTRFKKPFEAAYDSNGNIYVTDERNHRLKKYNSSFVYQSKAAGNRINTSGPFNHPRGIHIDSSDNIYVADYSNHYVRKYDTSLKLQDSIGGGRGTRLDTAKKVIQKIVNDTELTSGANFGLIEWSSDNNSRTRVRVPLSSAGAAAINADVVNINARGGTALRFAMVKARNEFTSGRIPNWKASCAKNYIIVISDGHWSDNPVPVTTNMRTNHNIKTFIIGFTTGSASAKYSDMATAGGTTSALFANNEAELLAKLTDAIKQAISGSLTFTTPAVMSDVTKGDYVYQSTFEYEKNKQWKGHLTKYELDTNDGTFGAEVWNAAEKLNDRSAGDRSIWTSGLGTISLNNFHTSYADDLSTYMYPDSTPDDDDVDSLINFVRGVDSYDEDEDGSTTDERHKLGDIYHSDLIVVGPVEASMEDDKTSNYRLKDAYYRSVNKYQQFMDSTRCGVVCKYRKEILLAGANDGMLHAFDTGTDNAADGGKELWAYIPHNMLAKLPTMVSAKANSTNSIYGVDGSPVVRDIYYDDTPTDEEDNPVWKTIVLSGLGAGGKGYFALDITNVDSPKHLFTIYNDTSSRTVVHLDKDENKIEYGYGGGGIRKEFDYSKLGETWSTPRIIRIKVDGKDKWVAVFGGGYNGAASNDYGSAVFVMDLENEGKLLRKIDIMDNEDSDKRDIATDGITTGFNIPWNYKTNEYYIRVKVDSRQAPSYDITGTYDEASFEMSGAVVEFATAPDAGQIVTIYRVPASNIINSIPADLTVITAAGTQKANYSGAMVYAADLEGKITKINLTDQGTLYESTTLFDAESNNDNGRFIYKRAQATINDDNNLWLYFGTGNTQKLGEQSSSIKNRIYGIKDKDFPNFVNITAPGKISECTTPPTCPDTDNLGWYVDLKKSKKVTAESTLDKDWVYFPLYEPQPDDVCKTGNAWLKAHYNRCGNETLSMKLGTGVLSKAVVEGDDIYIAISGEAEKKFEKTGNLIQLKSEAEGGVGKVKLEGWKEY